MHTLNRFLTFVLAALVLVPPATFALVSLDTRDAAQQSLTDAINSAVHTYEQRGAYQSLLIKGQKQQSELSQKVADLEAQEHSIRQQIVVQKGIVEYVSSHYNVTLTDSGQVAG